MRLRELLNVAVLSVMTVACAGTASAPPPQPAPPMPEPASAPTQTSEPGSASAPDPAGGTLLADGEPCFDSGSCNSGVCEGQGCTQAEPGTCAPKARACTRDLREYCGCDGVTFKTSGSCPGRRFASKGACPGGAP